MEFAQFIRSRKGNPHLLDSRGYTYFKTSDYASKRIPGSFKTYWECVSRPKFQCPARAITQGAHIIKRVNEHSHLPHELI